MLFDTSVRDYSGVFGCVRGMYKEYYGLSTEIPNSFISSALYAEKSCHKPEHFSKRDEVFGILWLQTAPLLLRILPNQTSEQ